MNTAQVARRDYVKAQLRLDEKARKMPPGMPMTARVVRNWAQIAYRAAMAEMDDPEPSSGTCHVCYGPDKCNIALHMARGWG